MTENIESDYARRVTAVTNTRFLPGTSIEIIHDWPANAKPTHAIFDFDGTISLVREGWPQIMVPMMVEILQETGTSETAEELSTIAMTFVMELCGKQTIYQMLRLAEEVEKRGKKAEDPLVYKRRYLDGLLARIKSRREGLANGSIRPNDLLVPYARPLLEELHKRGVQMFLASGTEVEDVREEARLLKVDHFFGKHIYGAVEDFKSFSKQMVIEQILRDNQLSGTELIGFGDGYVEIDNVKQAGGLAIAVASDETDRSGKPDTWKRDRLLGVGADVVVPDFQDYKALCEWIYDR
ncbi:MAG: HAD hydrolase-like protein [Planctomycetota bacterium]|nr:HAD hydrolase-like protein [Planctomycetota bacterium]